MRSPGNLTRTLFCFAALLFPVAARAGTPVDGYKVVRRFPHSTSSYTEGFFYRNGAFYEGTGMKGRSGVLVTDAATGTLVNRRDLPAEYFGEGIVDWGSTLYEWTWQSHTGFVLDLATLAPRATFHYDGEGWGMTQDGHSILTSDGSSTISFRNPADFRVVRTLRVADAGQPVEQLNELEYVRGEIYANVWHSDRIARISPADGHVLGWIDLHGLLPDKERVDSESVLNGIAYDAGHDRLFVTGKQWPWIFEIRVQPRAAARPRNPR